MTTKDPAAPNEITIFAAFFSFIKFFAIFTICFSLFNFTPVISKNSRKLGLIRNTPPSIVFLKAFGDVSIIILQSIFLQIFVIFL